MRNLSSNITNDQADMVRKQIVGYIISLAVYNLIDIEICSPVVYHVKSNIDNMIRNLFEEEQLNERKTRNKN